MDQVSEIFMAKNVDVSSIAFALLAVLLITVISLAAIFMMQVKEKSANGPKSQASAKWLTSFVVAFSTGCLLGDSIFHILCEIGTFSSQVGYCFLCGICMFFSLESYLHRHNHEHSHGAEYIENLKRKQDSSEMVVKNSSVDLSTSCLISIEKQNISYSALGKGDAAPFNNIHDAEENFQNIHLSAIVPQENSFDNIQKLTTLAYSILIGDFLHNAIDGMAIGISFLTGFKLGVLTSVAILFHEIPHEIADFAVLISTGLSKKRALTYCILSNMSSFLGVLCACVLARYGGLQKCILAFTAGTFFYIALADLIPELLRSHSSQNAHAEMPINQKRNQEMHSNLGRNFPNAEASNSCTNGATEEAAIIQRSELFDSISQHLGLILGLALMIAVKEIFE